MSRFFVTVAVSLDGDKWCALIGLNLQEGIAGFGDTPEQAFEDLALSINREGWQLA